MTIQLSASNQQTAEVFVQAIFSAADPRQSALRAIQSFLGHPWLDTELREHLVQVAADDLGIEVEADGE